MKRLNALFVPAGDPGDQPPEILLGFLAKQALILRSFHPTAEVWVSAQGLNSTCLDEFVHYINTRDVSWLTGVVYGPHTRITIDQLRAVIRKVSEWKIYSIVGYCIEVAEVHISRLYCQIHRLAS